LFLIEALVKERTVGHQDFDKRLRLYMEQLEKLAPDGNGQANVLVQSFGSQKRWVNYRLQAVDGKVTKVPYTSAGSAASSTDPATWSTHDDVVRVSDKVGIVFTPDQKLLGIDIDHCLKGNEIVREQKDAIAALLRESDTYTEVSPSGEGLHLFLIITESLPLLANKKAPFECYTSGRYFTVTGVSFGKPLPLRTVTPEEAYRLLAIVGYPWGKAVPEHATQPAAISSADDATVLDKMFASKNGSRIKALHDGDTAEYGGDDSSADMALCSHLAFWTAKNAAQMERIWLASPLGSRQKTQERKDYRNRTIAASIQGCGDVYEWGTKPTQEAGGTDGRTKEKYRIWTPGEILAHDFGKDEWAVESLIPMQGMTALSGNPGDFKTWAAIHMALCVSRGAAVFGRFKTMQGNVLIIDEEDHLRQIKKRLKMLGAKDADTVYYLSQNGIKIDVEAVRDAILEIVQEKDIRLLILDSLIRVHQQDENDAKGMAKVFSSLQKIIGAGASILFTHHHRKQQGFGASNPAQMMRGSSDILAAVDCHIMLETKRDEPDRLVLKQPKARQAEALESCEIRILKEAFDDDGKPCPSGFEYAGSYDEKKKKAEEASAAVVLVLDGGMKSRPEIQEALREEFGKTAIDEGIKLAEAAGDIERVPKAELPKSDNRKAFYRLPGTGTGNITGNSGELPASWPYIGAGNQEDGLGLPIASDLPP
jgi:hypothetical protein